ncbi:granulocyte-macrophage colony-stimulating factor receptor subunit alpha-like [Pyxicephalus adspersus]|uniref:granulocyte-macrophage colony-stimulating factor receptor subunit alpha-like n=1 Tax=Pyxicephalus adspersus TaxID=30357 RepID=UPI003B5C53FC
MKNGERYHYKTKTEKCNMTIPLGTHPAVCLKVIPNIDKDECQQLSSEKCIMRERIGTAAENVSCRVFNTSSMTCTWTFGKNAPHTNSYILSLRQKTYIVQCQQYERHFQTKTGACTFHDLSVNFFDYATIFLQGSDPGIQSFEKTIRLSEIEVFSPPRNISITSFKDSITIYWESPQTQEYVSDLCFTYNIEKNKDSYNASSNPFTISNLEKECSIRIRARGIEECDMNTNWGEWSEWIDCGL